jgi:drug/metabolite transporter (DMT)-like permease
VISSARRADLRLAVATLVWAASFVVVKEGLGGSSPLAFTALRFAIGLAVLTPFARVTRAFAPGELRAGALLGALLAVGFAAQTVGLVYTTPARSAFIVASSSVLAPVIAFLVNRERPRKWVIVALGCATVGMYLLTAPEAGGLNRGDLWTLVTACAFGAQIVAVAELSRHFDAIRLVWLETAVVAVGTALAALAFERVRVELSVSLMAALGYSGVMATAFALLWQTRAQREMSSARAALIFCLEPVFAAGISWLALGEQLSALQYTGGALIVGGMLLAEAPRD